MNQTRKILLVALIGTVVICVAANRLPLIEKAARAASAAMSGGSQSPGKESGSQSPNANSSKPAACVVNPIVTTSTDSGAGSLRQAIIGACAGSTITFNMAPGNVTSPITLTSGELVIDKSLTIQGPGANLLTISGNNARRIFTIANTLTVGLSGLTMSNGRVNTTNSEGGAIQNNGTLTISGSTISGSTANGSTNNFGGGICNNGTGNLTLRDSTVAGNSLTGGSTNNEGGGIFNSGVLTVISSTISGNSAVSSGGVSSTKTLTTINSTISGNSGSIVAAGLHVQAGTASVRNTIVAGNTSTNSPDVRNAFTSQGNNLIGAGDGSTGFTNGVNNDKVGTVASPLNPLLASLGNYGGPTQTMALLPGSPAIDAGDNCVTQAAHCGIANVPQLTTDQRGTGFNRLADGDGDGTATVDIGAFEVQSILVTNTNDSGAGSLRQAILDANANPDLNEIAFNIPGSGVHTISPISSLPTITESVILDGYTQPGASRNTLAAGDNAVLLIELNGSNLGGGASLPPNLQLNASNSTIRGLVVNRSAGPGITVGAPPTLRTGNVIEGNFIGTNPIGASAQANNGDGISIEFNTGALVGGTTPAARNIISGNAGRGIFMKAGASGNTIQGNFIGTNAAGTAAVGNISGGVFSGGTGPDTIGGTSIGAGNVISGNRDNAGILVASGSSTGPVIQGNLIGTDVTGTVALSNSGGIELDFGSNVPSATIGGTAAGARNVISGNRSDGVIISGNTKNAQLQGNLIGTDINGVLPLGNGGNGVFIDGFATNNKIGGIAAGQGNTIAFNTQNGVVILASLIATGNLIRGNSIFSNGKLGIDLAYDGITPNDSGDVDPGPNNLQNFPVISKAVTGPVRIIKGKLSTTPNSTSGYLIDFYTNSACDSAGGNGEGQTYLGSVLTGSTDANGDVSYSFSPASLTAGKIITATATDSAGNTSEFSACLAVVSASPGTIRFSAADYPTIEGDSGTHAVPVIVTRTGGSDGAVSVHYTTSDGVATTADSDYDATSGDLNWADGDSSNRTFNVTIHGDLKTEANESFNLTLSNVQVANLGSPSTAMVTILNDEGGSVSFSQAGYAVSETGGFVNVTVNRTGNTTGTATIDYATADTGAPAACGVVVGVASSRCDFTTAIGTLKFAVGEAQKTFQVLVNADSYVEGPETFTVSLSNPSAGVILAAPITTTITITDVAAGPPANLIDDTRFFVRQHYHDFLNREPDQPGWDFWSNNINNCTPQLSCTEAARISTSASFFLSIEFQQTGYLIERMYKASYGDANGTSTVGGQHQIAVPIVRFLEFLPDTQLIEQGVVVGQPGWEAVLENNKQTFAAQFVQRSRFATALPTTLAPAQFVDQLFLNAGATPLASDRQAAIVEFGSTTNTSDVAARGRALRDVAENSLLVQLEFNHAFVLMQYYGYLRRDPNSGQDTDYSGYDFWLTKLNQFNGNYINAEMVKAFIASLEYRQRFGQ